MRRVAVSWLLANGPQRDDQAVDLTHAISFDGRTLEPWPNCNFSPGPAMFHSVRRLLLLPLALLLSCAPPPANTASSASTSAPGRDDYVAVHMDTVATALLGQFVAARREWLGELRSRRATDGRGVFYTLRHFTSFGDFDTRGEAMERSLAAVPKEAAERYDRLSDTSLVYPHTTEIWAREADLGFAPASGALDERSACCGRIVIEDVRADPASEKTYSDATTAVAAALAEAGYPLTRITYRTVFGAGHVFTLWLAPSREALDGSPSVLDAVAKVRGAARAAELGGAIDSAVVHREAAAIVVRHDMTQ
jgi:hypothetical protein